VKHHSTEVFLHAPNEDKCKYGRSVQKRYLHFCHQCEGEWIGTVLFPSNCFYCRTSAWHKEGPVQMGRPTKTEKVKTA
jgi:hypothetical protein